VARAGFASIDEYLAKQPEASRKVLERVRGLIRKALPGAEERISYQIPSFRLYDTYVVYFAGWKHHFSLYPVTGKVQEALAAELQAYEVSKGTVRFPLDAPVPARVISRIARLLAAAARDRRKGPRLKVARPAGPGPRAPKRSGRRDAAARRAGRRR
jgi:uncharacterized protein YdhG (YjbR/CyaY superfamily)